jgi:tetratricopeptide (TPR) repeat protein
MNDTAIAMYERATGEDPRFTEAYAIMAIVCFANAEYSTLYGILPGPYVRKGEAALERAVALDGDNWMVLRAQAQRHILRREFGEALAILRRVLERQPNDAGILQDLGLLLNRMRRLEEALPFLAREYELNPKGLQSGFWVGYTYWMMRRWDDALKWLNLIVAQKPEYVWSYARKANVLVDGFGNLDEARSVLDEGLLRVKDLSGRSELLREKYRCALIARDFMGALAILARKEFEGSELELGGSELVFRRLQMGHTYRMMGKPQDALTCYASIRDTSEVLAGRRPDDPAIHITLSQVYAGLGRKEEALREGRRAIELEPLAESPIWLGELIREDFVHVNIMVGEFDVAIAHLDTLLSIPSQMTVWRLKLEPWYDPLRSNPRFQAILAKGERMQSPQ